jgi:hypothetical protein
MSEPPSERQAGVKQQGGELVGPVEANSRTPGSRSLQAGGEFLKALASDLAAAASRLRLPLTAKYRRTGEPRASAPSRIAWRSVCGRALRYLGIGLWALGSGCAVVIAAITLWLLYGLPVEPQKSDAGTAASQSIGPPKAGAASAQELGREPAAQDRPAARAAEANAAPRSRPGGGSWAPAAPEPPRLTFSSTASSGISPPALAGSTTQETPTTQPQTETGAGADQPQPARTETQDRRPADQQQAISTASTESGARPQCNVDLCAARYASFRAADCTYQPYGGGPRSLCELSSRSADARPQTARAAHDSMSEATDLQGAGRAEEVPRSATPARAGAQCHVDLCAATYASFHAADCTYQPYDGGPRRICER